jgi:hypothetical protein
MNRPRPARHLALALALSLVLAGAIWSYAALAQGAQIFVIGQAKAICERSGREAYAGTQQDAFGLVLRGFYAEEPIRISVTFPDGRVLSLIPTVKVPAGTPVAFDGSIDPALPNPAYTVQANVGGDYYEQFVPGQAWPYGCYAFSALGINSGSQASAAYVITPGIGIMIDPGPATLDAINKATRQSTGAQGAAIDLFGRGFLGDELIELRLVRPDGSQASLPSPRTSLIGSFQASVPTDDSFVVGTYTVLAIGQTYSVSETFRLVTAPIFDKGMARLRLAQPNTPGVRQGATLQLQGQQFGPAEPIAIRVGLANGAVVDLTSVAANEIGEFAVDVQLSGLLPVGAHRLLAIGASGQNTASVPIRLTLGSAHVSEQVLTEDGVQPLPSDQAVPAPVGPTPAMPTQPDDGKQPPIGPTAATPGQPDGGKQPPASPTAVPASPTAAPDGKGDASAPATGVAEPGF